ncbi:MAG TPA: redoxin domain-containing protein [Polyangiaceae bacterium]|nr:redoxin domain-containing protein [Polyangiaceae bacterium]
MIARSIRLLVVCCACLACLLGCAARPPVAQLPPGPLALRGSDGAIHDVASLVQRQRFTVFVFYSEACPCVSAHEQRLAELHRQYRDRGIALLMVNSEIGANPNADAREAARRRYPFLLLTDPQARLATALGAEFATHAVVVDPQGTIRYSGAIDSDKIRLKPDATPYLRNALDDLLAARTPRAPAHEPLGCSLRLR